MKLKSVLPFVAGLMIMQSCSTPKNDVMWVGGIQTPCDSGNGMRECLNVFKGEDLKDEKWEIMHTSIEGLEFEEGFMKKIEVIKTEKDAKDVPADASSINYTFVKELERKEDPRAQLKGNWVLATINGGNINRMIVLPTLMFDVKGMRISGNGGCNLYSTQIDELSTQKIKFKQGLGTLMACANENIEEDYHKALSNVSKYAMHGDKLEFHDKDGKVVLTYIKVDPSQANPALGGQWKNTRINGDTLAEGKDKPSITFDLDKMMVAGKDACNNFNATIKTLSNADLELGEIASTKMMCPDMEIPQQFLSALSQVVTYKVIGSELIMLDNDGTELLVFSK